MVRKGKQIAERGLEYTDDDMMTLYREMYHRIIGTPSLWMEFREVFMEYMWRPPNIKELTYALLSGFNMTDRFWTIFPDEEEIFPSECASDGRWC